MGNFLLLFLLLLLLHLPLTWNLVLRPKSQSRGLNPNLEAQILAFSLKAQIPASKAKISAPRSKYQPKSTNSNGLKEKIPHMCESIDHQPLQGRYSAPSLNFTYRAGHGHCWPSDTFCDYSWYVKEKRWWTVRKGNKVKDMVHSILHDSLLFYHCMYVYPNLLAHHLHSLPSLKSN